MCIANEDKTVVFPSHSSYCQTGQKMLIKYYQTSQNLFNNYLHLQRVAKCLTDNELGENLLTQKGFY